MCFLKNLSKLVNFCVTILIVKIEGKKSNFFGILCLIISREVEHFPGGLVVKSLPTNARDIGLIPGPGRSHMA